VAANQPLLSFPAPSQTVRFPRQLFPLSHSLFFFLAANLIPEEVLIRDVVYVFQGIDGEYIKFDKAENSYVIDPKAGIPRSVRIVLGKLSELGWLFRKLRDYTERTLDNNDKTGLIEQSFREAVQAEIRTYYRVLAQLEAEVNAKTTTAGTLLRLPAIDSCLIPICS